MDLPEIVRPRDLADAVRLTGEGASPSLAERTSSFACGRAPNAHRSSSTWGLPELRGIHETEGGVEIGAAATHAEILSAPATAQLPILRLALATIGSPALRHMGTLGGTSSTPLRRGMGSSPCTSSGRR